MIFWVRILITKGLIIIELSNFSLISVTKKIFDCMLTVVFFSPTPLEEADDNEEENENCNGYHHTDEPERLCYTSLTALHDNYKNIRKEET